VCYYNNIVFPTDLHVIVFCLNPIYNCIFVFVLWDVEGKLEMQAEIMVSLQVPVVYDKQSCGSLRPWFMCNK